MTHAPVLVVAQEAYRRLAAHFPGWERVDVAAERFRNGELHLALPGAERLAGRPCVVLGTAAPPDRNALTFTMAVHAARRAGATRVTALMPYLAYARQDQAPAGASVGIRWLGELLAGSGVDEVVTVDVHSEAAAELVGLPVRSLDPAPVLAAALPEPWRSETCFVAPDAGARERCAALAEAVGGAPRTAWLEKRRTPMGVEHVAVHGHVGPRAVLVDDIVDTGITLLSACELLRGEGVREIAVVATHGVLTGTSWLALWPLGVRLMLLTDSVATHVPHRRDLHVVSLGPLLEAAAREAVAVAAQGPVAA
ncbi:MAG TPA: ribose-phosphate diphosphokinase [Baekduia sp.]|nr:ribose-phosphate diphosphokinase [Baekduia sp.]